MYLITPELYSTKYRAVGLGSASVVTRLGGAQGVKGIGNGGVLLRLNSFGDCIKTCFERFMFDILRCLLWYVYAPRASVLLCDAACAASLLSSCFGCLSSVVVLDAGLLAPILAEVLHQRGGEVVPLVVFGPMMIIGGVAAGENVGLDRWHLAHTAGGWFIIGFGGTTVLVQCKC